MKKILSTLAMGILLCGIGISGTAEATLISQDLSNPGDGLLTYDSDTGLSWLDVSLTVNHSYSQVLSGFGGYTTGQGFRYATADEVGSLFSDAGVVLSNWIWGYWNFSNPNYLANATLMSMLGITYPSDGLSTYTLGMTGDLNSSNEVNCALIGYNNHADYIALKNWSTMGQSDSSSVIGSFLVRDVSPVPEPATALLFGAGVAGLAIVGRRKKN